MNYSSPIVKTTVNLKSDAQNCALRYALGGMTGGAEDMVIETLGDRAKARREQLKLTQTEVARRVNQAGRDNVKIQHIQKLEKNKQRDVTYLAELALALECDPIWLGTGRIRTGAQLSVDETKLWLAWEAVQTAISEHEGLNLEEEAAVRLAAAVYGDLGGGASEPLEAARRALTRLLVERLNRSAS